MTPSTGTHDDGSVGMYKVERAPTVLALLSNMLQTDDGFDYFGIIAK
jgi:hypothetical protein